MDISREELGQMIVVRASGHLLDHQREYPHWESPEATLRDWIENLNVGGVILLGASAVEVSQRTRQLQRWSKHRLLIAADIEEGLGQRFSGGTHFPPPMSLAAIAAKDELKAIALAKQMGLIVAEEALAIGINWLLAPVVDVNNNPNNPVINVRAFGSCSSVVSKLTRAFIEGVQAFPALASAKHFPGHGDTAIDSHLELPTIEQDIERLMRLEIPPFISAISAEVASIMTAHLLIPAWDQKNPATLSRAIITELLRKKLGFQGLIVTDALIMGGISKYYSPAEIALKAVEAGVDILLMPEDPHLAIDSIYQALETGRLDSQQIEQSLKRIARYKAKLSAPSQELVTSKLYKEESKSLCQDILVHSMTQNGPIPLIPSLGENVVVVDDLLNCPFLTNNSAAIAIPTSLGYQLKLIDLSSLSEDLTKSIILQVFIRGNPFKGQAGLSLYAQQVYTKLISTGNLQAVVIYGSPYVADWFIERLSSKVPFIFTYGQERLAQEIALNKLFALTELKPVNKDEFTD